MEGMTDTGTALKIDRYQENMTRNQGC
jgi:hypothetical protein